jgi:hypothetical protein
VSQLLSQTLFALQGEKNPRLPKKNGSELNPEPRKEVLKMFLETLGTNFNQLFAPK